MARWFAAVLAVLISGCIGFSNTRLSEPHIDGALTRFEENVGDMYVLQSVDLHVYPLNSKSKTMMVFPIPFYDGEGKSAGPTFSFFVSIVSKQAGQSLMPQDFAYISSSGDHFSPSSMVGPYDCRSQQARPAAIRPPLSPVSLAEGRCYTMLVAFEAPKPDPGERFRFAPGALQMDHETTVLPVVSFSESTRGNTVAVP